MRLVNGSSQTSDINSLIDCAIRALRASYKCQYQSPDDAKLVIVKE